jgi:hypothetical protein
VTNGRFTEQVMTAAMRHLAAEHNLNTAGAKLLRLTNNAVFALPAASVVVRIARSHQPGDRVAKGVALAQWFEQVDAPTIRLADMVDQPLLVDGLQATVWRYLPPGESLTPRDLGAALREFQALGLPPFPLPAWDPVVDARACGWLMRRPSTTATGRHWRLGATILNHGWPSCDSARRQASSTATPTSETCYAIAAGSCSATSTRSALAPGKLTLLLSRWARTASAGPAYTASSQKAMAMTYTKTPTGRYCAQRGS